MFQLKPLSPERIPAALDKAERYRLLNEPVDAESICRDILLLEPDNVAARIRLLLALTDQFTQGGTEQFDEARHLAGNLPTQYERDYYLGIVYERWTKARFRSGGPQCGAFAYDWFTKAMDCFEKAAANGPPDNDEALLRWNTCARFIMDHPSVQPAEEISVPLELE